MGLASGHVRQGLQSSVVGIWPNLLLTRVSIQLSRRVNEAAYL